jgi:hypothetical protein
MIKLTRYEQYLEELIIQQKVQLDQYRSLEPLLDRLLKQMREPETVTCKYKLINGHSRKQKNGKQCPPNCQILVTREGRQWGKGCQNAHWVQTKRKKDK